MSGRRMGIDPSLAVAGARRTLRRLELEAYASVMTAFRAQGPLTGDKKCSLEQLGKLLGISSERHRAEVRRAANDELLSAIASCVSSTDSEEMWQREGQKLASTIPRFVARQLSHLPHLLTSAAVSNALNLQSITVDPELRKNTSTQVQNVLKYIISQNPLNSVTTMTAGAKQTLGKSSLTTTSVGKTLAKSLSSKPTSSSGTLSCTTTTTSTRLAAPTPSTTSTNPRSTPSGQSRTPEKLSPTGNKDIASAPSPAKDEAGKHPAPTPEKVISTTKQSKGVAAGGKSSMLVGLLEGRKSVSEVKRSNDASGAQPKEEGWDGVTNEGEENKSQVESRAEEKMDEGESCVKEKEGDEEGETGEEGNQKMKKEDEDRPSRIIAKEKEEASIEDEEKAESRPEEEGKKEVGEKKEEEDNMDTQCSPVPGAGNKQVEEKGSESELVCEEVMPITVPARDNNITSTTATTSSGSEPSSAAVTDTTVVPPPSSTVPAKAPPSLSAVAANVPPSLSTVATTVPPSLFTVATTVPPSLSTVATTVPPSLSTVAANVPPSLSAVAATVPPSLSTVATTVPPSLSTVATTVPPSLSTVATTVPPSLSTVAANVLPSLSTVAATVPPSLSTVATTVPPSLSTVATTVPPSSLLSSYLEEANTPAQPLATHPATTISQRLSDEQTLTSTSIEEVVRTEEASKEKQTSPSLPAPQTGTQTEFSQSGRECPLVPANSHGSELKLESRKRPHPTDTALPPSPKKARVSSPSASKTPSPPLPPPTTLVPQASKAQIPSSLPIPPATTCAAAGSSVTKSPVPPPLLFSPLPPTVITTRAQETEVGGRKKENTGVPESILRQFGPGAPLGRVGGVTIQPLLSSSSLSLASVCLPLVSVAKPASLPPVIQSPLAAVQPTHSIWTPPPLLSFTPSSLLTTPSSPLTLATSHPPPPIPLQIITPSLERSPAFQATPIFASSLPTPTPSTSITGDVTMMSSTSDEALIRALCSEAAEDTTAAALASQLGLEFLEPNLLGGLDLMQFVSSPLEEVKPAITGNEPPAWGGVLSQSSKEPSILSGEVVDTTQLLSEALTSLSNPSTPLYPTSLSPFHSPLFPTSSSLNSPSQPTRPQHITPHISSPFTPHTPRLFTPSLSSPLTPEILPDIEDLASANEADLLEGIPPELAETIQALAQFESPLQ